ncbi:LysR family transcriptional regulator [Cupriavidus sp. TMH.W2]|uniref:LysR family transcriptional regulator n=1 Tax=Cupriavidus sp. TMH.W2 TaxID=3434465 RepID=UPI003D771D11
MARFGNVTRAAEALHVTQPAVSGQLRQLEEELGLQLFTRTKSSVALTQCGQELLARAEKALEAFGDFVHAAKALHGHIEGDLRIGVVMLDPGMLRVGPLLNLLVRQCPALRIDLHVGRTPWLLTALQASEIDAAIMVARSAPKGTSMLALKPLTFRLVAPSGWKSRVASATPAQLAQVPWLRMTPRSAHQELLTEILTQTGITPVETVLADHELMIRELVVAGVGIGLLREDLASAAQAAGELVFVGDYRATTHLAFLYPEERENEPAICAVREALRELWELAPGAR